jgi:1-deoxy-D-xylulose-5-phosphate reductoisomerase
MKGVAVLGSTGSIGIQTLDIVRLHPYKFKVASLAAGRNVDLLEQQVREFRPSLVACGSQSVADELRERLAGSVSGVEITTDLTLAATVPEAQLVVGGLPGSTGLTPTFAAVEAGKDVALATKEVLVMAGELFMKLVKEKRVDLLPVDSEQSALFQCLHGNYNARVRRMILTASGGPFRDADISAMDGITPEQALNHPRWKMGPKVSVDSATLMNKGLEVIEASWLFDVPASKIEVLIHPESIVHSMVEFQDGSIMAQLGVTDMRIPISYAMAYPERIYSGTPTLDFVKLGSLNFREPDTAKFPLLKAAYEVLESRTCAAAIVYNAADEVAVDLFLSGKISFGAISRIVLGALDSVPSVRLESLTDIAAFHEQVCEQIKADWN